jgi:flagellar basal body rod protein FlgF
MENALLIGLSRQTALERQLDVIANNIANVNTAGFKSDNSLFEEYLNTPAHEDNFVGSDRRVSFVQDRGTYRNMSQGSVDRTGNPLDVAIDGSAFLAVQTAGGERYTRDGGLHINAQGQLVTVAGNPVLGNSGPIVFQQTDHDVNIAPDGTVTVIEGSGRADSIRGTLFGGRRRRGASRHQVDGAPGLHRKVERQLGRRDEPHDGGVSRLHLDRKLDATAERVAENRHPGARRRAGLTVTQETIHASPSHCCDRDGGPGT